MAFSSLNSVLKHLTRVGRSESVYQVASADRINAIQDAIRLLVRGENIVSGNHILKKSSDGYVVLTGNARGAIGGGSAVTFPFQLIGLVEATSEFDPTIITRVQVMAGKVNGEFPDGMLIDDDPPFKLDITNDTTLVVQATFDPATLVINSRTCFESDDVDDSTVTSTLGTLNFLIGYAQIQYDGFGNPIEVTTQNNFVGNMNFELVYGSLNGKPAILPVTTYPLGTVGDSNFVEVPIPE